MVSGLVTSPHDHQVRRPDISSRSRSFGSFGPRISSGEAIRIWMKSKLELRGSRTLRKSIILLLLSVAVAVHPVSVGNTELHPDAQRLQLLHEDVERLRNTGLGKVLAFHNRLVHAATTVHVVGLDGQDLLQRVRGAVRLERPHLHLA